MFEMLDAIDWSQVANCYGLSDVIPVIRSKEDFESSDTSFWNELLLEGITPAPVSIWILTYLGLPSTLQGLRAFIEKEE